MLHSQKVHIFEILMRTQMKEFGQEGNPGNILFCFFLSYLIVKGGHGVWFHGEAS